MRRLALGGVLLVTVMGRAWAGGIEFPTIGSEALGRGGAFVARADDGTAAYHNPAGFAQQRGTRVLLGANVISLDLSFTRAGTYPGGGAIAYGGQRFPTVTNGGDATVAPLFTLSTDFGGALERAIFYVAGFPPSGNGNLAFPDRISMGSQSAPAPQRYDITQKDAKIFFIAMGLAYRLTETLDVGAGFWWGMGWFDLSSMAVVPGACQTAEDPMCDVPVDVHASQAIAPSGNLGVLWHPASFYSIGASLRLPVELHATGTARIHMPGSPPQGAKGYSRIAFDEPLMLQLGGRVKLSARTDVELDLSWENWSDLASVDVDVLQPDVTRSTVHIPHDFSDTMSLRVGGEWNPGVVALRAGLFYDQGAAPDNYTRLDFAAFDKVGLTLGVGVPMGPVRADIALALVHQLSRDIAQSRVIPQNAIDPSMPAGGYGPVGTGHYESSLKIFSLTLQAAWP
jgi:long-chain fatty acid transport protein